MKIKTITLNGALLLTGSLLSGCGGAVPIATAPAASAPAMTSATTSAPATPKIQTAAEHCGVESNVQDNGASISFDTKGDDDETGDSIDDVACVLDYLDTPEFVVNHMDATRALDGTQEDEWAGYKARWAYHPDSGVNMTLIDTKAASAL